MSQSLLDELNKQQWGSSSKHAYARLSTTPDFAVSYDDEAAAVTDVYHVGGPRLNTHEKDYDELYRDDLFGHQATRALRWRRNAVRYARLAIFVTIICALLTLAASKAVNFLRSRIPRGRSIYFTKDVLESDCCSPTYDRAPMRPSPIRAHMAFSDHSLEQWIAYGRIANDLDFSKHVRIDAVTTWVNGSDPRHKANRDVYSHEEHRINDGPPKDGVKKASVQMHTPEGIWIPTALQNDDRRFREFDELRYSVRSTRQHLGRYLGTHHLITTDFWRGERRNDRYDGDLIAANTRRGQVPDWLDTRSPLVDFAGNPGKTMPAIRIHHDWQIFVPLNAANKDLQTWKAERLPTFSSTAVEAVLGLNVSGLAETFFLASDDMFLTANITTADFFTPLFGPVIHMDFGGWFIGRKNPIIGQESTGMEYSVSLLRKRFNVPGFGYPNHMHKALSQSLLVESRIIWRDAFERASLSRFRSSNMMANTHMIMNGMIIERHREALLWSYLVGRIDLNGDGQLDDDELALVLKELDAEGMDSIISVKIPKRDSNSEAYRRESLHKVGFPTVENTLHKFTSFDGYALSQPDLAFSQKTGLKLSHMPPKFTEGFQRRPADNNRFDTEFCELDLDVCWPRDNRGVHERSTDRVFRRFAFDQRGCGDCLIKHLMGKSGRLGVNAFLPSHKQVFPDSFVEEEPRPEPDAAYHLSLSNDYETANFTLAAVAKDNNINRRSKNPSLRVFAMRLIARYNYSLGMSPGAFEMLRQPVTAEYALKRLKKTVTNNAFLCINDDIVQGSETIKGYLRDFFETVWPSFKTRYEFEKTIPLWPEE